MSSFHSIQNKTGKQEELNNELPVGSEHWVDTKVPENEKPPHMDQFSEENIFRLTNYELQTKHKSSTGNQLLK